MKRPTQQIRRITGAILILFLLFWLVIYVLVTFNKESINEMAITQINKQVKGNVKIGNLTPEFFRTFPNISVCLSDVLIRDSLWDRHHHDFLKAEKIYIRFHWFSLITGKPGISKVIVENGSIYLYTDDCGYCNLNRSNDVGFTQGKSGIPEFSFDHVRLVIENQSLNSFHDIEAEHLDCKTIRLENAFVLVIAVKSLIHGIGFNLDKGSYLKEKVMEGKFRLVFSPGNKMELNNVTIKIEKQAFKLNGNIFLAAEPMSYDLSIQTKKILYQKAVGMLTQSLQTKMKFIDISRPLDVDCTLTGQMARKTIPKVTTHFAVQDADMHTPLGEFNHCTYTGNFTNQLDTVLSPGDKNSRFIFNDVHQIWTNISMTSTQVEISNLLNPYLIFDLQSEFGLADLNELTKSATIQFLKGTGRLDITYRGPLSNTDTLNSQLNGNLTLEEAEINYLPRNLNFNHCNGILEFKDKDLIIRQLLVTSGQTNLKMTGQVSNLLALLNINPEQLTIEWNISTPNLNLNDFVSYVGQRSEISIPKSKEENKMLKVSEGIDRMLSDGTAKVILTATKVTYKKFVATDVTATMWLVGNKVMAKGVKLNHAGGKLFLNGSLTNGNHANYFNFESNLENVDIPGIFYAFDNFGQDAITHQNMKGKLTAKIIIAGVLTDDARIIENSMKGTVEFNVKNGELINFEPVMKISTLAFKKRDFSDIRFAELTNRFDINGSAFTIHKMEIRSNVAILFVEGVYDSKKGTDMSIQIPVSNLSKAENENLENTGKAGMNIRLRAKTSDDGKLKISWDPFNKASRPKQEETKKDSVQVLQVGKQ